MRVIIIEDEIKTAQRLRDMLLHIDDEITVEVILLSVVSAIRWLKNNPTPELIFSDIQLGDGLSFEIFKEVQTEAAVIFCTAFDEYAIKAFESNSIDYLMKPIEEESLRKSLEKYDRIKELFVNSSAQVSKRNTMLSQLEAKYKQTVLVHYREKIIPVKVIDIQAAVILNGVVQIFTADGQSYSIQLTIENLESTFDPQQFFRVNRSAIINRDAILDIEHYFNRKLFITTRPVLPEKIIISKNRVQPFLKWIEQ